MRRIEMQAQEKRLTRPRIGGDHLHRALAEQARRIADIVADAVVVPEIMFTVGASMREIIDRAAAEAIEMIIAAFQRAEFGQRSEMPFTDQRRAVARFLQ